MVLQKEIILASDMQLVILIQNISFDHLNDDVLSRTLDAIAAYGPIELFNEIIAECLLASDYGTHCLHVDTTAFSVSGEYDADFDSCDMTSSTAISKTGDGRVRLRAIRASGSLPRSDCRSTRSSASPYLRSERLSGRTIQNCGRPKADEPGEMVYTVVAEIEYTPGVVDHLRQKLGRFVLATNDLELSTRRAPGQLQRAGYGGTGVPVPQESPVPGGEIYLKNPSQIQALAMIMVLYLFAYAITEFRRSRNLQEAGETMTSQTKKQTRSPTLK
jgi:hypothetical protein